jgi:hypothetical protein
VVVLAVSWKGEVTWAPLAGVVTVMACPGMVAAANKTKEQTNGLMGLLDGSFPRHEIFPATSNRSHPHRISSIALFWIVATRAAKKHTKTRRVWRLPGLAIFMLYRSKCVKRKDFTYTCEASPIRKEDI